MSTSKRQARPPGNSARKHPSGTLRDLRSSFEGLVAERARLAYCAHWRADNENPALTSFLKILGERYPLPTVGG